MADQTPKTIAQTIQNKEKEQVEAAKSQVDKKAGVSDTKKKASSLIDKIKGTVNDIKGKIDANKAKINSIAFALIDLMIQSIRGKAIDRTNLFSVINAREESFSEEANHTQGRIPAIKKSRYGCSPTPRAPRITVKTNQ